MRKLFEFFDWKNELRDRRNAVRDANDRVTRSLIGHQESLGPSTGSARLHNTIREPNRARGSGEIATELDVVVEPVPVQPARSRAPNHNRGARRSHNIAFPDAINPLLPPSSSTHRGRLDIDAMQQGYAAVARSISSLAFQQRVRSINEINDDIIVTTEKLVMVSSANTALATAYSRKIADLEIEWSNALLFDAHIMSSIGVHSNE